MRRLKMGKTEKSFALVASSETDVQMEPKVESLKTKVVHESRPFSIKGKEKAV